MLTQWSRWVTAAFALSLVLAHAHGVAQTRFTYSRGQSVSPAYEGWWQNDDASYTLFFGYMNSNWEEELDVPIGSDNRIEPGGPDRGQPTHFYPRRNMFLFTVEVPADFGDDEVIWTLTTNGRTERAYGCRPATTSRRRWSRASRTRRTRRPGRSCPAIRPACASRGWCTAATLRRSPSVRPR